MTTPKRLNPKQFAKLTQRQRAMVVADDLLQQIEHGVFMVGHGYGDWDFGSMRRTNDARCAIIKGDATCEGCARAGLFFSTIVFKNKITLDEAAAKEFSYENDLTNAATQYLSDTFSLKQQAMIETAYEGEAFGRAVLNSYSDEAQACLDYYRDARREYYHDMSVSDILLNGDKFRELLLINILTNIIMNNGEFKPDVSPYV